MCVVCRYLNAQSTSKYRFGSDCGGRIESRANAVTGEPVPVEPWVNEIDPEDWDWFQRRWAEMDAWDWQFRYEMARSAA